MNNPKLEPTSALSAKGLTKAFQGLSAKDKPTRIFESLDFEARVGETVAIVGASGAGKSTLLHILGGLDKPDTGEVMWAGEPISGLGVKALGQMRNKHLGFIYQFHHLLPEFSALDNVAMPLRIAGLNKAEARHEAAISLSKLGLSERLEHRPAELSGGERQRVAIARALVTKPSAILADEPTGNLDQETADKVFDALLKAKESAGTALIMVTHSLELAQRCDRIMRLDKGKLVNATPAPKQT